MSKSVLSIIGISGLLGREVMKQAKNSNKWQVVGSDIADEVKIDITDPKSIEDHFNQYKPDAVVNCAAYTDVDGCETEKGFNIAEKVNGYGVGNLAKACKKAGSSFVHISTDYVFGDNKQDGHDEYYDKYLPLNNYAKSKLLGEEELIKNSGGLEDSDFADQDPKMYILRTSWLYGKGAKNFISRIIELAKERDFLEVVTDEISSPTYIKDLAERILYILDEQPKGGIYHASGNGACSRYDFAKEILKWAKIDTPIKPCTHEKYPRKTKISEYSYLLNTKLPPMRDWKEMVEDYISNEHNA